MPIRTNPPSMRTVWLSLLLFVIALLGIFVIDAIAPFVLVLLILAYLMILAGSLFSGI